jgi:Zn-dependent protease
MATETGGLFKLRLLGIDVDVQGSFLFTALLFGAAGGRTSFGEMGAWIGVVFVSVLWHELGHALVGRTFGATPRIELNGGGGLTFDAGVDAWWKELLVCLAGPLAGFVLGGVVWAAQRGFAASDEIAAVAELAIYVNVGWGMLNLLPVFPYDGGQAFRAVAVRWLPQGLRVAVVLSLVVATLGVAYALLQRRLWLAYLAGRGAAVAYRELKQLRARRKLDDSRDAWGAGNLGDAERIAREALAGDLAGGMRAEAVERVAWAMLGRGDWKGARAWLAQLPEGFGCSTVLDATLLLLEEKPAAARVRLEAIDPAMLGVWRLLVSTWMKAPSGALDVADLVDRLVPDELAACIPEEVTHHLSTILFHGGKVEESANLSSRAFTAHGAAVDAYNVACCASRLGHADHALVWLEKAVNAGWSDAKALEDDDDLSGIRELDAYRALVARVRLAG